MNVGGVLLQGERGGAFKRQSQLSLAVEEEIIQPIRFQAEKAQ